MFLKELGKQNVKSGKYIERKKSNRKILNLVKMTLSKNNIFTSNPETYVENSP